MRRKLSMEDLPVWLWSTLVTEDSFVQIPPNFTWPEEEDEPEEEGKAAATVSNGEKKETPLFRYVPVKTQLCVGKDLRFCESLATAYSRILEDRNEKIFLRGNSFLAKITKAVFENDKNLFISTCEEKDNKEEYFKECFQDLEEQGLALENNMPSPASWGSIFDRTRLLIEEHLATRLEGGLPVLEVSELNENSESESNFDIIVAPQNAIEENVPEASLARLEYVESSSDSLVIDSRLFLDFLSENFPCRDSDENLVNFMARIYGENVCDNLDWFCQGVYGNSMPRPNFQIDENEQANVLGYYKNETIYISKRLVIDSLPEENQKDRFALLITMLHEYGIFLDTKLREKAGLPISNSELPGRAFVRRFMKFSRTNLFHSSFEFAVAKDRGREYRFKISGLSYNERKNIYLYIRYCKYAGISDFKVVNYKTEKERKALYESTMLKMSKTSPLWNTLKDYHYGEMLKRLNEMDSKLDTDKNFEEIGYLLRILWKKYEEELVVHDTKIKGQMSEQGYKEFLDDAKKNLKELKRDGKTEQYNAFKQKADLIVKKYKTNYIFKENGGKYGVKTDLLNDTYLKKWTRAYQITFHEFFHNIDYIANPNERKFFSYTYRANEKYRFGETLISDVKKISPSEKEYIHGLEKWKKAYLYDIMGGALFIKDSTDKPILPGLYGLEAEYKSPKQRGKSEEYFGHAYEYWMEGCEGYEDCLEDLMTEGYENDEALMREKCEAGGICREERLSLEAFANMASAAIVSSEDFKTMKAYLSNSYEMFVEIIEVMIDKKQQK